ncbi:hypothetical protein MTR67_038920, partial [Solanum verrucosum]
MQKQSILNQLTELDLIQDQRTLSNDESYLRAVLKVEFEDNAKREEVAWRQRSRALRLKEGDMNSKFFHRMANCHKRYNNIDKLIINDSSVTEPAEIRDEVTTFYQKLYRDKAPGPDGFTMAFFKQCWEEVKQELVAAIQ